MFYWYQAPWKDECADNDWLKKQTWALTPSAETTHANYVFGPDTSGAFYIGDASKEGFETQILPVVYLSPLVLISKGNGSVDNPYILSLS